MLQKKNSMYTVAIGGYVRIFVGSGTMPTRHRADFKEALSTLRRLKNEEDQAVLPKLVAKLFLILVELAR